MSAWADIYFRERTEYMRQIMPLKIETARLKRDYWKKMLENSTQTTDQPPSSDSDDNI